MNDFDFRCINCNKMRPVSEYSHRNQRGAYCMDCEKSLSAARKIIHKKVLAAAFVKEFITDRTGDKSSPVAERA